MQKMWTCMESMTDRYVKRKLLQAARCDDLILFDIKGRQKSTLMEIVEAK